MQVDPKILLLMLIAALFVIARYGSSSSVLPRVNGSTSCGPLYRGTVLSNEKEGAGGTHNSLSRSPEDHVAWKQAYPKILHALWLHGQNILEMKNDRARDQSSDCQGLEMERLGRGWGVTTHKRSPWDGSILCLDWWQTQDLPCDKTALNWMHTRTDTSDCK